MPALPKHFDSLSFNGKQRSGYNISPEISCKVFVANMTTLTYGGFQQYFPAGPYPLQILSIICFMKSEYIFGIFSYMAP